MTLEQFKEVLVKLGYKLFSERNNHTRYKKRNNSITIQEWDDCTNVFYDKDIKNGSYEYNQHGVSDFAKALKNILKFERKIGK